MATTDPVLETLFVRVVEASWQALVLAALVLAVQGMLHRRLPAQWRYGLWAVVVVRLLLPVLPTNPWSLYVLLRPMEDRPAHTPLPGSAVDRPGEVPVVAFRTEGREVGPASFAPISVDHPGTTEAPKFPKAPAEPAAATPDESAPGTPRRPDFETVASGTTLGETPRILPWLPWVWAAGVGLGLLVLAIRCHRTLRLLRGGRVLEDPGLQQVLGECSALLGIRHDVSVVETPLARGPALLSWGSPRILVPPGLMAVLGPEQRRHILLHELAHLRRRDLWVNQLLTLISLLHWFNPLLPWVVRRVRNDMESACDATVLRRLRPEESRTYGRSILAVLEKLPPAHTLAGTLGVLGSKRDLWRRFRAIAEYPRRRGYAWAAAVAGVSLAVLGLTVPPEAEAPGEVEPPRTTVEAPRLENQRTMAVQVLDAATEQGVAGVNVGWRWTTVSGVGGSGEAVVDGGGRLAIPLPEELLSVLSLQGQHEGYWSWAGDLRDESGQVPWRRLIMVLLRVGPAGGRVMDLQDRPVAGATVTLRLEASGARREPVGMAVRYQTSQISTVTRGDGTWYVDRAVIPPSGPESPARVRLEATDPDYAGGIQVWGGPPATGFYRNKPWEMQMVDTYHPWTTNLTLRLAPIADLWGRVISEDGEPIAGATVVWQIPEHRVHGLPDEELRRANLTTAEDGSFLLERVRPWLNPFQASAIEPGFVGDVLFLEAAGFAPRIVHFNPATNAESTLQITMRRGSMARGRLLDELGNPVAGEGIQWDTREGGGRTQTRADGRFEVGPVAASEAAEVRIPAYEHRVPATRLLPDAEEQVIRLRPPQQIEIRAIDARSGEPLDQFEAFLIRPERLEVGSMESSALPAPGLADVPISRVSATGGGVQLSVDSLLAPGPNRPGLDASVQWWVKIEAAGFLPTLSEAFSPRATTNVTVRLSRATWWEGTVWSPEGHPVEGAKVAYVPHPYPEEHLGPWREEPLFELGQSPTASIRLDDGLGLEQQLCLQTPMDRITDAQGRFSLPPRNPGITLQDSGLLARMSGLFRSPPEDFIVAFHESGIAEVPVREFRAPYRIELRPWGAIRVRVGNRPEQAAGWQPELHRMPLDVTLGGGRWGVIKSVSPGEWFVAKWPPGKCTLHFWVPVGPSARSTQHHQDVEVLPGVTNEVRVLAGGRKVVGRFTTPIEAGPINWRRPPGLSIGLAPHALTLFGGGVLMQRGGEWEPSAGSSTSPLVMGEDGSFRVDAVEPGEYVLRYDLLEAPSQLDFSLLPPIELRPASFRASGSRASRPEAMLAESSSGFFHLPEWVRQSGEWHLRWVEGGVPVASVRRPLDLPQTGDGGTFDLGNIDLQFSKRLALGQPAPPLRVETADARFDLAGCRGKWVLLAFISGPSMYPAHHEPFTLARYAGELKRVGKIEVAVFDLDVAPPAGHKPSRDFEAQLPWPVVRLGPWQESAVADAFGVRAVPEVILVDPQGRVAGIHLRGRRLLAVVDALSPAR